ncbi:MAG: urea amidolyase associated protein UAAP1 [Aquihabitans sp.]
MDDHPIDEAATDSLEAALAHARAQAGTRAATQATVPSTAAVDLPDGVDRATVTWDEVLGAGGYASGRVRRGDIIRVTDLEGGTCANLQLHHAALTSERLNPADTVKVQWQAYLGEGALLLSDLGRVLATITADTSNGHDALCGHSNRRSDEERFGHGAAHGPTPNVRDLLALAAARHDLGRRDLTSGINLFSAVRVAEDGGLQLGAPTGVPGYVELRAELDLVVLIALGPHPLDDRSASVPGPVRITSWAAERPVPDPFRDSTPERLRAFENSEQFVAAVR